MRRMVNKKNVSAFAVAAVCTAGVALGQPSTGPDVLVGELPDLTNQSSEAVGGINFDAFSVGTTSCNKGNTPLNWHTGGTDNRHPVIGQNLFRLSSGRFEQIGQSWLKHGFTALQGSICSTQFGFPCSATSGITLGVGCSDPYSSGLNAGQSGLGPKWQVNAATGLFPYPFANPAYSGSTARRLRVRSSDIVAGAQYFIEGQYVCGDDAGMGNKNNNASWKQVAFTGSSPNFTMAFAPSATTHREQPAIYAWQLIDPSVSITTADIVGDGRFILACKVTQSGANYTYEYALHNLNSDRCAGSFAVPFPSGTAVSGVGFHDAEYHSGEPNQLANPTDPTSDDWTVTTASTSITWSGASYSGTPAIYTVSGTTPFKVDSFTAGTGNDHTANVLRWGTLFNFRFTTTVAPALGSVQIGLWRPGSPSAFGMAVQTPGGATIGDSTGPCCIGQVCSITSPGACTGTFGAIGATCTPDPCQTGACCALNGSCSVSSEAACSGTWTSGGSCSPNNCPAPTGACCNGADCTIVTAANCTGSYIGDGITCGNANCQALPANDACSNAVGLCDGVPVAGSTVGATDDGNASCAGTSGDNASVWYSYTPSGASGTVSVTVDTCSANYDTAISVWSGACPGVTQVACDDDACGNLHSRITATLNRGQTYLIRVSGYNANTGTFTVTATGGGGTGCQAGSGSCCNGTACTVTTDASCSGNWTAGAGCSPNPCDVSGACCSAGNCASVTQSVCQGTFTAGGVCSPNPCAPLNDGCNNREGVGLGTTPFDTTNATTDGPANALCDGSGTNQIGQDIWFNFPCTFDGTVDIDTCGSSFDTRIAVYSGTGCTDFDTRILACNDDTTCPTGNGLQSRVTIPVTSGEHYTIRVGGYNTAAGVGQLTITAHPTATGSCCAADGSCLVTTAATCSDTWTEAGVCSPNPCAQPTGACCSGTACTTTTQAACTGTFQGVGSACGQAGNPTTCCPANFNDQGGVTVQDIFDFLAAYFANAPAADFNGQGGITVQDIFDFLAAYFGGCPG